MTELIDIKKQVYQLIIVWHQPSIPISIFSNCKIKKGSYQANEPRKEHFLEMFRASSNIHPLLPLNFSCTTFEFEESCG